MIIHCVGDQVMPVKLDAPVSGSVIAAEAGTLTFMVWLLFYSNLLKIHINYYILLMMILGSKAFFYPGNQKNTI